MGEAVAVLFVLTLFFVPPLAAVVLSIIALVKVRRARRDPAIHGAIDELKREVRDLRRRMSAAEGRVGLPVGGAEADGEPEPEATPEPEVPRPTAPPPAARPAPQAPPPEAAVSEDLEPGSVEPESAEDFQTLPADKPSPRPEPVAAPKPKEKGPSLEQRWGAKLPVWIGSVALALAGAFLVKYSFDQGWLSPPVRVTLGILFGLALLAAGELLRKRVPYVSQGCSAAGVADLYACFLAAVNLYHLMPAMAGFAFMALTTAVAVLLSLRQGPLIAVLGFIGGFFTPYWISTGEPRPAELFAYLLLLQVALLVVTRKRRWWPLAGLTLLAGMGWVALWLGTVFEPAHGVWVGGFILGTVAVFLASGFLGAAKDAWGSAKVPAVLNWASLGLGLLMMAFLTGVDSFDVLEWSFLGVLAAAALLLARREPEYEALAWFSSGVVAALLLLWTEGLDSGELWSFLGVAMGACLLFGGGAYACLWGARSPARWASLSTASAVVFLLIAYGGQESAGASLHWGIPCIALAVAFLAGAIPVAKVRRVLEGGETALAALAVGITSFVSLAVPMELERQWLGVAWAFEVAALFWIAGRLRVTALQKIAMVVAALVAVRLLLNPLVFRYPTGDHFFFNWILYGYGLPILAFGLAAFLARSQGCFKSAEGLEWSAAAMGLYLLGLEVRQFFHPGNLDAGKITLNEWGALSLAWMALALGLILASGRYPLRALSWGGRGILVLAVLQTGFGQCLVSNPLWTRESVGSLPVINGLLFLYGAPCVLVWLGAWILQKRGGRILPPLLGLSGLGLLLLLVTLEVRHAFHGEILAGGAPSSAELYAYSGAWVLLGVILLVLGFVKRGPVLRGASLAVMLLAVGKVFLYDIMLLGGLYRFFSFAGLGISLLFLGFLYQRFLREGNEGKLSRKAEDESVT